MVKLFAMMSKVNWSLLDFSFRRHYGVLLLYGEHIAVNHLVATNQLKAMLGYDLIDQSTTDDTVEYMQKHKRLHMRARHANETFSKFAFKTGGYNQTDLEKYRNDTTARAYVRTDLFVELQLKYMFLLICLKSMRMALESKYMTSEELLGMLRNATSTSGNNRWSS